MATNALGAAYPLGSDPFAPHTHIKALADSLEGRVIVPVANATARAALAASVSPSASEPLFVFRADATAGRQLEYTTNGTTWMSTVAERYGTVTPSSPWTVGGGEEILYSVVGRTVTIQGRPGRAAAISVNGSSSIICNVASLGLSPQNNVETLGWVQLSSFSDHRVFPLQLFANGDLTVTKTAASGEYPAGSVIRFTMTYRMDAAA